MLPKWYIDRLNLFCASHPYARHISSTDRHTDHAALDMCSNRPLLALVVSSIASSPGAIFASTSTSGTGSDLVLDQMSH